ncbi:MAG TPA: ATP-dependent Clp protease adaptor ClpS [Ferruginibacter sp.]|nr:ATP-dependent Clp protease adaptor ClpS [Ferruginibacter sp.]
MPYRIMALMQHTKHNEQTDLLTSLDDFCTLIVWNDDVNTFEWVIETLIKICGHTQEQAEQCAIIIDSKGKYAVKEGSYDLLKPQCDAITDRGINATIEVIAN